MSAAGMRRAKALLGGDNDGDGGNAPSTSPAAMRTPASAAPPAGEGGGGGGGFGGFSTGNGKAVAVSAAGMRRAKALLGGDGENSDGTDAPSTSAAAMHTPASAPSGDFTGGGFGGFSTGNGAAVAVSAAGMRRAAALLGRVVQVDPIKTTLKALGSKRLKL